MDFIVRFKTAVALVCFTLFCVISLALKSSTFSLSITGVGSALMSPFQKGYHSVENGVHLFWAGFTELGDVRKELKKTQNRLQQLEGAAVEMAEIKSENAQLRNLIAMKPKVGYESIPAIIISKDPDNWFRNILVNRGSDDGVKVGMPVIAYNGEFKGVVGKVVGVRGSVSRVLPIISSDMKAGVMMQESRYPGLMSGYSANAALCKIDYISRSAQIKPGDMVITSGQGGIFPQGLLIGNVVKMISHKTSSFQQVIVKPIVDFDQLEQVFIIKAETDPAIKELLGETE